MPRWRSRGPAEISPAQVGVILEREARASLVPTSFRGSADQPLWRQPPTRADDDPAFGKRVQIRASRGQFHGFNTARTQYRSEGGAEFRIPVVQYIPQLTQTPCALVSRIPAICSIQVSVGCRVMPATLSRRIVTAVSIVWLRRSTYLIVLLMPGISVSSIRKGRIYSSFPRRPAPAPDVAHGASKFSAHMLGR